MNLDKVIEEIRKRSRKLKLRMDDADWEENEHPRAKDGKFAKKGGGESGGANSGTNGSEVKKNSGGSASSIDDDDNDRRSTITKTKQGTPFPKLKKGAMYTKALGVAEKTALKDEKPQKDEDTGEVTPPRLPKGAWEKTIKSLKPEDVVYIKDVNGNDVGVIPGLAARVDNVCKKSKKMQKIFDDAQKDSKQISDDMIDITRSAGLSMDGLENCCKGASHLEDKAKRKFKDVQDQHPEIEDLTEEDVALNLGDAVRFTAIAKNDNIVDGTNKLISELEKRGYKVSEVDNKFKNKDGSINNDAVYRAIHLTVEMPNGRKVEVQVHSAESMAVKNLNHVEYDEQNKIKKDHPDWKEDPKLVARMNELDDIMIQRWHDNYTNPKGIESINSYDRRSKDFRRA